MDNYLCLAQIGWLDLFLGAATIIFREVHVDISTLFCSNFLFQGPLSSELLLELNSLIVKLFFKIVFTFCLFQKFHFLNRFIFSWFGFDYYRCLFPFFITAVGDATVFKNRINILPTVVVFRNNIEMESNLLVMSFKGNVMQTGKALVNDHSLISKVSWKFWIPTSHNFAVIYPWNLLFS